VLTYSQEKVRFIQEQSLGDNEVHSPIEIVEDLRDIVPFHIFERFDSCGRDLGFR